MHSEGFLFLSRPQANPWPAPRSRSSLAPAFAEAISACAKASEWRRAPGSQKLLEKLKESF